MDIKLDTSMAYEQYRNQNKMEFLFISDIIKEDEKDDKNDKK